MKKSELVLGNLVKGYKGEEEFVITSFNKDVVVLNNKKEVKVSTFLKNYKLIKAVENKVEVELPTFQLKLMAPMVATLLPTAKVEKKAEMIYYQKAKLKRLMKLFMVLRFLKVLTKL